MVSRVIKSSTLIPRQTQSAASGASMATGTGARRVVSDSAEGVAFLIVHSITQPSTDAGIDLTLSVQLQHSLDGNNWVDKGSPITWEPAGIPSAADLPYTAAVEIDHYSKFLRAKWTFEDADSSPSGFSVDFEVNFGGKT